MTSKRSLSLVLVATLLAAAPILVGSPAAAAGERATYVVRLSDAPLASYRGGIAGLAATNPDRRGEVKLDADSATSVAYLNHLASRQRAFVAAMESALIRNVDVLFRYRYAFNGVAVKLTSAEAATVARLQGVAGVQREFRRHLQTDAGPQWIGAPAIWNGEATGGSPATKGEGVVVGVIDTGVNHDHPSFADVGGDGYDHENPRGQFYGMCDPVLGAPFCNDKLIGVWDFTGTGPEDDNQHGSHTASTSAGNALTAVVHAPTLEIERPLSGVAPHANLITYKACIAAGCLSPSLTAAIDQAVADEVDVINYSIGGGPSDPWDDSDSLAFLGARDAGVFVSVSAGNDGPGAGTVGSPANSPWVTSVGASTHDRVFANALTGMSGGATAAPADITGKSFTAGHGPAPIVHAADFGDNLCGAPFAPGTFDGEIVICDRGVNPRVEKGRNVEVGGAGGMVLANTAVDGESTIADPHELPAVHIGYSDAQVLLDWVGAGSGHTATIAGTTADQKPEYGDVMAGFSSRGPNEPAPGVIKPDVSAPGVDVLAATHTTNPTAPPEFGLLSGTSMSSPHTTGSAALVRALHPEWTPAQVQSALMTTALNTTMRKDDGVTPADAFDMGSGRVDLTKAGAAGLLFDETTANYEAANPAAGGDPSTLNIASLGSSTCKATCTWTRTVSSALSTKATWRASVAAPQGMTLSVSPRRFTLNPGATDSIKVTATVNELEPGEWAFAQVNLKERSAAAPAVHLPVAVLPGGTPESVEITAQDTQGSETITLEAPLRIRRLSAAVFGLSEGVVTNETLVQDPTPLEPYDGAGGTFHVTTDVPAGAQLLAAEIADTTANDLDLFVGLDSDGDGQPEEAEEVCRSASETALESCKVESPEAGTYWIMVQNWLTGRGADDVDLAVATVPGTDNGNLTVTGPRTRIDKGASFDVTLAWSEPGLAPGTTWFALVRLGSDATHSGNVGALFVTISRPSG